MYPVSSLTLNLSGFPNQNPKKEAIQESPVLAPNNDVKSNVTIRPLISAHSRSLPSPFLDFIIDEIKKYRALNNNISIDNLCPKINVTRDTLRGFLNKKNNINILTASKIIFFVQQQDRFFFERLEENRKAHNYPILFELVSKEDSSNLNSTEITDIDNMPSAIDKFEFLPSEDNSFDDFPKKTQVSCNKPTIVTSISLTVFLIREIQNYFQSKKIGAITASRIMGIDTRIINRIFRIDLNKTTPELLSQDFSDKIIKFFRNTDTDFELNLLPYYTPRQIESMQIDTHILRSDKTFLAPTLATYNSNSNQSFSLENTSEISPKEHLYDQGDSQIEKEIDSNFNQSPLATLYDIELLEGEEFPILVNVPAFYTSNEIKYSSLIHACMTYEESSLKLF